MLDISIQNCSNTTIKSRRGYDRDKNVNWAGRVASIAPENAKSRGDLKLGNNSLRKIREQLLMSKAELARKAGVSPLTIDRIESGKNCRMETKRKIILALGYSLEDKDKIFGEDC